jgi:PKD repeat protein
MKKIFIAVLGLMCFPLNTLAMCNVDLPDMTFISLSEINFDYEDGDYIEFYINKPESVDLKYLEIEVDGKNLLDESTELKKYNLVETSLVSTTEQVLVKYAGKVIDGVCWQDETISKTEQSDYEDYQNYDLPECFFSESIDKSLHLAKNNYLPSNNLDDWSLVSVDTPGEKNNFEIARPEAVIEVQSGELISYGPTSLNLDGSSSKDPGDLELDFEWDFGNGLVESKENPGAIEFKEIGNYVVSLKVTNSLGEYDEKVLLVSVLPELGEDIDETTDDGAEEGFDPDLNGENSESDQDKIELKIIDFMANPEGSDSGNEWIELKNTSDVSGYAVGWTLDDSEGQSSGYKMDELFFEAGEIRKIYNSESKVNLNNSDDMVRILYKDEVVEKKMYDTAVSGVSFISSLNLDGLNQDDENVEDEKNYDGVISYQYGGYDKIRLNEIMPNPEGKDSGNEWLEIYNYGKEDVDLGGWYVMVNSKKIELDDLIMAGEFRVEYIGGLSNSGAVISLYSPDDVEVSQFEYGKSVDGYSYANLEDEWGWVEEATEGSENPKIEYIEGVIEEVDEVGQTLKIENLNLVYEEIPDGVEAGAKVKIKYLGVRIIEVEIIQNVDLSGAIGSIVNKSTKKDNIGSKVWLYIGLYLCIAITGFYFRKPLFKFMKAKLAEI